MEKIKLSLMVFMVLKTITTSLAQDFEYGFLVEFTDKNESIYAVGTPGSFLSERAIERRLKFQIPITAEDFPVNKTYTDSLSRFGARLHVTSRWLNSGVFLTNNSAFASEIATVSFVKKVSHIYTNYGFKEAKVASKFEKTLVPSSIDYGMSENQLAMCNIQLLHNQGYFGKGIHMAVLDGGFYRINEFDAFSHIFQNNLLLGTWDFVSGDSMVFEDHQHGMNVLSIIAGNLPGQMMGSATEASFWLLRSEDVYSEYPIEEENWIAAAEFADSAGVDIITASLGYSIYDDALMSHTNEEMDGKTARVTLGAEKAFSKGIFIVNSAGNEGDNTWRHITAPSDGEHVLCIGAVDSLKNLAYFSSVGPSSDNRTKPDVVGQGVATTLITPTGEVGQGSGTSFSCPLIAGMVACLWQALPNYSNLNLLNLIRQTASQHDNPDNYFGFGIPDFAKAFTTAQNLTIEDFSNDQLINIYPIPFSNYLELDTYIVDEQTFKIQLIDLKGAVIFEKDYEATNTSIQHIKIYEFNTVNEGSYLLNLITKKSKITKLVIK